MDCVGLRRLVKEEDRRVLQSDGNISHWRRMEAVEGGGAAGKEVKILGSWRRRKAPKFMRIPINEVQISIPPNNCLFGFFPLLENYNHYCLINKIKINLQN